MLSSTYQANNFHTNALTINQNAKTQHGYLPDIQAVGKSEITDDIPALLYLAEIPQYRTILQSALSLSHVSR